MAKAKEYIGEAEMERAEIDTGKSWQPSRR